MRRIAPAKKIWFWAGCGLVAFTLAARWWIKSPAPERPARRPPPSPPTAQTPGERNALWISLQGDYYSPWRAADRLRTIQKILALAQDGEPHAQQFMGMVYQGGIGVGANPTEAQRWYSLAEQQGITSSRNTPMEVPASTESAVLTVEQKKRYEPVYQTSYQGNHPDLFAREQDRVRLLLRQAQVEISSQLGLLQYREGFQCPLIVRFDDRPAPGVEFALAYVQIGATRAGFVQEMVINLDVMAASSKEDFDKVFYHEMTHAVLNDAVSAYERPLPSWVQEGLAVYIGGDGPDRVRAAARSVSKSRAGSLARDLQDPVLDYARNYLAFKYMLDRQSINTLQTFVRNLTQGRNTQEAVEESTGLTWNAFREKVKEYSAEIYRENARPD